VLSRWDRAVVEAFQHAHWGPANWVFVHLSDWWVHGLLFVAIALAAELWARRLPVGAVLVGLAYLTSDGIVFELKRLFERPRPPLADSAIHPLVAVPHDYSMPSGHAATAFGAAVAAGFVHPRLRPPLLVLAALVALSRVWLGVHYLSDVLVGAAVGTAVAAALWLLTRASGRPSRGLVARHTRLPGGGKGKLSR